MKDDALNRIKVKRGEGLPQSKLTDDLVRQLLQDVEYRKKLDELRKDYTSKSLAKKYGVHVRTIEKAIEGYTWSHITL